MKRKAGLLFLTALVTLGTVACGDSVAFDSSGGGGTGAGGGGGNGGDGGDGDVCALYEDAAGSDVTFRIENGTGQPIYLPTDCGVLRPTIEPGDGDGETYYGNPYGGCFASCETWQQGEPPVCTAGACALTTLRLEAGEIYEFVWSGTAMRQEDMPAACWFDEQYVGECTRVIEAEAQSYLFDLRAYSECIGECSCEQSGQCYGEAGGLEGFHDVATFTYPEAGTVDVVFGPCAFGCADPQP
ncbi:MAG TPA: hypothetical protein ENK57_06210 [Polyangiaceae bacterium]|nr:hypothetical protein [Polyangiaceae bacterium]